MWIVNESVQWKDPTQTRDSDITTAEIAGEIAFGKETDSGCELFFIYFVKVNQHIAFREGLNNVSLHRKDD